MSLIKTIQHDRSIVLIWDGDIKAANRYVEKHLAGYETYPTTRGCDGAGILRLEYTKLEGK